MSGDKKAQKFLCAGCGFMVGYDYFGKKPPFFKAMVLLEDAYVIKCRFLGTSEAVVLGSHCSLCKKSVCVNQDCSLFYTKRFCMPCVRENLDQFPEEIQMEVSKKIQD